jgi:hypothetical protein
MHRLSPIWSAALSSVFSLLLFASSNAHGEIAGVQVPLPDGCENIMALTPQALQTYGRERAERMIAESPRPNFDRFEMDVNNEQDPDLTLPKSFLKYLPPTTQFIKTPIPATTDLSTMGQTRETYSSHWLESVQWKGRRTVSEIAVSLPTNMMFGRNHIIPDDAPLVNVHLHGVGTTSTGPLSGTNIGEYTAKQDVPTVSIGLPGHSLSTKNPDGLLKALEQLKWIREVMRQTVPPGAKIIFSGHSGGAMFVLLARYYFSHDPDWAQVVEYLPMSPGVDTSRDGNPKEKVLAQQDWEKNFERFKGKTNSGDYEFMEKFLESGKFSNTSGHFVLGLDFGFVLPRLSCEEEAKLKPMTLYMGTKDLVTLMGREDHFYAQYKAFFDQPNRRCGDSKIIMLEPGVTFESKNSKDLKDIGHDIFAVYKPGTTTLWVYDDIVQLDKKHLPDSYRLRPLDQADKVFKGLLQGSSAYSAVRELIEKDVEYVKKPTPVFTDVMVKRKAELASYVALVAKKEKEHKKAIDEAVNAALLELRKSLNLPEKLSPEYAQEALTWGPLTPARQKELETYVAAIRKIDDSLDSFTDAQFEMEKEELAKNKDFAPLLIKLGIAKRSGGEVAPDAVNIKKYKKFYQDALLAGAERKKLNILFTVVENIHNKQSLVDAAPTPEDKAIEQTKLEKYISGKKFNLSEANLSTPEQFEATYQELKKVTENFDELKRDQELLGNLDNEFSYIEKQMNLRATTERDAQVKRIRVPEGVTDSRAANRELRLDRSRPEDLQKFIDQYSSVVGKATAEVTAQKQPELEKINKPDGIETVEQGKQELDVLEAKMNMTYQPGVPEIDALAWRIQAFQQEYERHNNGGKGQLSLNMFAPEVVKVREQLSAALKTWEKLWVDSIYPIAPNFVDNLNDQVYAAWKSKISSPKLTSEAIELARTRKNYKDLSEKLEHAKADYHLKLIVDKNYVGSALTPLPREIRDLEDVVLRAKEVFQYSAKHFEISKITEALEGHLNGPKDLVERIQKYAKAIWGTEFLETKKPSSKGIIASQRVTADLFAQRSADAMIASTRAEELRTQYIAKMKDLQPEEDLAYDIHKLHVFDLLDQEPEALMDRLRSDSVALDALGETHRFAEAYASLLRAESQQVGAQVH